MPSSCMPIPGRPARAFLAERGFTLADADQFGMGYAPQGGTS